MSKISEHTNLDFGRINWVDDFGTIVERDLVELIKFNKLDIQMQMSPKAIADYLMVQLSVLHHTNIINKNLQK